MTFLAAAFCVQRLGRLHPSRPLGEQQCFLPQNYSWLELAEYGGNYYISFPPVPSLLMTSAHFLLRRRGPKQFCSHGLCSFEYRLCVRMLSQDRTSRCFFHVLGNFLCPWQQHALDVDFRRFMVPCPGLNLTLCFGAVLSLFYQKESPVHDFTCTCDWLPSFFPFAFFLWYLSIFAYKNGEYPTNGR